MDDAEFDEKDIEDEIARELSCLDSEDELSSALTAADDDYDQQQLSNDEQSVPDVQLVALPESKALKDLQKKLSTTRKTFEKQLEDCSHLLQSAEGMPSTAPLMFCYIVYLFSVHKQYDKILLIIRIL